MPWIRVVFENIVNKTFTPNARSYPVRCFVCTSTESDCYVEFVWWQNCTTDCITCGVGVCVCSVTRILHKNVYSHIILWATSVSFTPTTDLYCSIGNVQSAITYGTSTNTTATTVLLLPLLQQSYMYYSTSTTAVIFSNFVLLILPTTISWNHIAIRANHVHKNLHIYLVYSLIVFCPALFPYFAQH